MNHFSTLIKAIFTLSCVISMQTWAQSAPAEKATAQIKRIVTSANPVTVELSKNLFKTEEYQAPYMVKVPYQATETYTVEVPYQEEETYTVQVPYQDTETYTENIPYEVSVPYTDYETVYRNERQCSNVIRYRQECHSEQKCYLVPGTGGGRQCRQVEECGTNVHGERICKTREVCEGQDSAPQQRCENQNVCQNVPYNDQECRDVSVPYRREVTRYRNETRYRQETRTRSVTRYRNETRSRTVTRSRTETRTREVTKYREEEKCCVTKTRQVFDRQLQYNVNVVFPQDTQLTGNETETLNVKLISADANTAQVQVEVVNSIFGYKVVNQTVSGASIQIELQMIPKYDLTNAGVSTIQNLKIDYLAAAKTFQVSFADTLNSSRVQSNYAIVISDLASGVQIEELAVTTLANGQLGAVVKAALDSQAKIKATLKVTRSGILISGSQINFETSVNFEKRSLMKEDVAALSDAKLVSGVFNGAGVETTFQLIDQTPEFTDVATSYEIFLTLKTTSGGDAPLKTTVISREALKQQGMSFRIADLFKSASEAQKGMQSGRVIKFTIHAKRKGTAGSALGGKTVQASSSARFAIQ